MVTADDGIDYILGYKAPLIRYINGSSPDTCSIASVDLDFVVVQSPITKKVVEAGTDGGDGMDGGDGADDSNGAEGGDGDATNNVEDIVTSFAVNLVITALDSSVLVVFFGL